MTMDKIHDRGTKKWAMAMMLPEHVEAFKKWMDEDHYVERPQLDDFDPENIQESIDIAYKRRCETHVATWGNGEIMHYGGKITEIDIKSRVLILDTPFGIERLPFADIVGVQCEE